MREWIPRVGDVLSDFSEDRWFIFSTIVLSDNGYHKRMGFELMHIPSGELCTYDHDLDWWNHFIQETQ